MREGKNESITEQQRLFCRKFVHLKRKRQAAIEAGYSPKSAQVQASKLLKMPKIMALIARYESEAEARHTAKALVDADRIIQELEHIALADVRELFAKDGKLISPADLPESIARATASIKVTQHPDGGIAMADIKLLDKQTALKMLGQDKGLFVDKHEHTHKLGDMTLEELIAERDKLHQDMTETAEAAKAHGVELDRTRH
jgi:phage terminase small subunit